MTLRNVTIIDNQADADPGASGGGGVAVAGGFAQLANTILANNIDTSGGDKPDCLGSMNSNGHNLIRIPCTITLRPATSRFRTQTSAPCFKRERGQDKAPPGRKPRAERRRNVFEGAEEDCQETDARGVARPQQGRCDIGAAERLAPVTITPTTTADEYGSGSDCSVREAIRAAGDNAAFGGCPGGGDGDTISMPPGVYALTRSGIDDTNVNGDLDIATSDIALRGAGGGISAIDGSGGGDRVLHILDTVQDARFERAEVRGGSTGAGSQNNGAGIRVDGELDISQATITANHSGQWAGGVYIDGSGSITNSTISGNISDNLGRSGDPGGPADRDSRLDDHRQHVGGLCRRAQRRRDREAISNSIVAGNSAPAERDCNSSNLTSEGHNLLGNACITAAAGDVFGQVPQLAPLADNGGSARTHVPLPQSPALNAGYPGAGPGAVCEAVDQRAIERPQRGRCDIGAVEAQDHTLLVATGGDGTGRVTGPGIDCPGDCSESLLESATASLTPEPATGSLFGAFSGACSGASCELDDGGSTAPSRRRFDLTPDTPPPPPPFDPDTTAARDRDRQGPQGQVEEQDRDIRVLLRRPDGELRLQSRRR